MKPDKGKISPLVGNLAIFIGFLLTLSFLFLPSAIIVHYELGSFTIGSYFYMLFIFPLGMGIILCLLTKRYYGIAFIGLLGILIPVLWYQLNASQDRIQSISIGYGYYLILSGFLVLGVAAVFMAKKEGLRLFEREKLYVLALNILLFFVFVAGIFSMVFIRGTGGDVIVFYLILLLIVVLTLPGGVPLVLSITKGKITKNLVNFSLSLTVWGIYFLLFSILSSGSSCSCSGCVTSFSFGLLLFTPICLWFGISGLLSYWIIKHGSMKKDAASL